MRRWILRTVVCLILGAITTVGIAWGCAWWWMESPRQAWQESEGAQIGYTEIGRARRETATSASLMIYSSPASTWESGDGASAELLELASTYAGEDFLRNEYFFGWPALGLGFADHADYDTGLSGFEGALVIVDDRIQALMPVCPIWPGFLINTLFYAAIWGGVFFGFASAKRAIRRRRGRCPRCGYDLRGHRHEGTPGEPRRHEGLEAGCPECGSGRKQ